MDDLPFPTALLIAGGGIGGLATALALAGQGIASHVVEGRDAFSDEGAGIQLGPNAVRILSKLGVAEALAPVAGVPNEIRILDGASARVLAALPLGPWIAERHGAPYWVAHRSDVHSVLLSRARAEPMIRITTGATVATATPVARGVSIAAEGGARFEGPALVAADGVWSRLRPVHFDPTPPRFEERCAARTVIPRDDVPSALAANATFAWLAPGAHVVHYPVRGGRDIAVVVVRAEATPSRDWSTDVLPAWVREATSGFHASLRRLLEAGTGWRRWSLYSLPTPRRIANGPMALLGDAAHPVLPFLAQGGVMALEDAVVLAREAARTPEDLPAAFQRYQHARRARIARVAEASRRNGRIFHLGGPLALARNATMAALGGKRIIAGYDWLYGFKADDV